MSAPIGLQLYSVRGECQQNLPAALDATAKIGYQGVEPWGYGGNAVEWMGVPGQQLRQMLDDRGLRCCGMHIATAALLGDNLARTIELNQQLGNTFLIVAADKDRMASAASIQELADILNRTAETLAPLGLRTGYHAHGFDFAVIDGEIAWDRLFRSTRPEVVMQMDIGNCVSGGGDPYKTLEKFPGRAKSVHLKDYGGAPDSVIGEGKADWPTIFRLCDTLHQPEWYVVEEGGEHGMGFDICARSLQALRRMGR